MDESLELVVRLIYFILLLVQMHWNDIYNQQNKLDSKWNSVLCHLSYMFSYIMVLPSDL